MTNKKAYGILENVLLTESEYIKFHEEFLDADILIDAYSEFKAKQGFKMKSDYAALRLMARTDYPEKIIEKNTLPHIPKYVVVAINRESGQQAQKSDLHTWAECKSVYLDYSQEYADCNVFIHPAGTRELMESVYNELHDEI